MSKIKDWKINILNTVYSEIQGMEKVITITFLSAMKIGQLVLLQAVLTDKTAIKDLLAVIKAVNTNAELEPFEKSIKGKGFTQAESLVNFTSQLKDDQRLMLESLTADTKGSELLKKGIDAILADYLYVR